MALISSSKWSLHKFFSKNASIRMYLPPTALYYPSLLNSYLHQYQTVYIKPAKTHMGRGILRVWRTESGYQFVKERGQAVSAWSLEELKHKLSEHCREKQYIIQKGIDLAEINGRPFDIRVMMMRNGAGRWQYAGMLAKVAGTDSIITNVARGGGYVLTVPQALLRSQAVDQAKVKGVVRQLIRLSHQICTHFNKYKHSSQIGVDFAVDKRGEISIIEVNFDFPSHGLFAKLPDKTYYRKIKRLRAQYLGRVKAKKRKA